MLSYMMVISYFNGALAKKNLEAIANWQFELVKLFVWKNVTF